MRIAPFREASDQQACAALDLLRTVLSAEGAVPLAPVHHAVLDAVARHFFGIAVPVPAGECAEIPQGLRRGLAELAVLMPLSDVVMDARKVEAAARVIEGLGMAVPQVALLRDAAAGRLQRLRLRVANPLARQLAGIGPATAVLQVFKGKLGLYRDHARRLRAAQVHAPGSLGREMLRYYDHNPFVIPGEKGGLPPDLVGRHDYLHVITGYDTSTEGELCLSGFVGACAGDEARLEAMIVGLMQFNQAVPVQEFAAEVVTKGAMDPNTYFLSAARGAACSKDVAHPRIDYMAWLDRDLDEIRAEYGVRAEGMMVHAGQPRWGVEGGKELVLGGQKRRTTPPV